MSRVDEVMNLVAKTNKYGGVPSNEWITLLLTDIAISLANIADELNSQKTEREDVRSAVFKAFGYGGGDADD